MSRARQFFDGCGRGNRYIPKRIEKFYRCLQFFLKELAHVRYARGPAAKKQSLGRAALLLRAIVTDGTHYFRVEAGHGAAHQFGNTRHLWIRWLGAGAAETSKTIAPLPNVCSRKRLAELPGDRRSYRASANGYAPKKDLRRLNEKQIGRAGANVD